MTDLEFRDIFTKALQKESIESHNQFNGLYTSVYEIARREKLFEEAQPSRYVGRGGNPAFDRQYWGKFSALFWEHVMLGIISIGYDSSNPNFPFFAITDYGMQALQKENAIIFDPTGMIENLEKKVGELDIIVKEYLSEALICLRRNCYRATIVMVGCASEQTFLNVVNAYTDSLKEEAKKKFIEKSQNKPVYRVYEEFRKRFDVIRKDVEIKTQRDDWQVQLDSVFNLIRYYRNECGHPKRITVDRQTAFSITLLFPHLYEICNTLCNYFNKQKS